MPLLRTTWMKSDISSYNHRCWLQSIFPSHMSLRAAKPKQKKIFISANEWIKLQIGMRYDAFKLSIHLSLLSIRIYWLSLLTISNYHTICLLNTIIQLFYSFLFLKTSLFIAFKCYFKLFSTNKTNLISFILRIKISFVADYHISYIWWIILRPFIALSQAIIKIYGIVVNCNAKQCWISISVRKFA